MFAIRLILKSFNLRDILYIFTYKIIYFIFNFFQNISWRINGISRDKDKILKDKIYELSAQRFKVCLKFKFLINVLRKENFLITHTKFEHPRCVLDDKASLLLVDENEAVFVVTENSSDIYDSNKHPFLYDAQYECAKELIVMPLFAFHKLAASKEEKLDFSASNIIWISSTGRCGSTLLTQIFEKVPRVLIISEPDVTYDLFLMLKSGMINLQKHDDILRDAIKLQCKGRDSKIDYYVIKTRSMCLYQAERMPDFLTNSEHFFQLFMFRDRKNTILSFNRQFGDFFEWLLFKDSLRNAPILRHFVTPWISYFANPIFHEGNPKIKVQSLSARALPGSHVLTLLKLYEDVCERKVKIGAVNYDDLVLNPERCVSAIFEYVGIPNEHVSIAITALETDSQRAASWVVHRNNSFELSKDDIEELDKVAHLLGVPKLNEEWTLPNVF